MNVNSTLQKLEGFSNEFLFTNNAHIVGVDVITGDDNYRVTDQISFIATPDNKIMPLLGRLAYSLGGHRMRGELGVRIWMKAECWSDLEGDFCIEIVHHKGNILFDVFAHPVLIAEGFFKNDPQT